MTVSIDFGGDNLGEIAAVFALLARLWQSEVDAKTLKSIRQPAMAKEWKALGGEIPDDDSAETIEELAIDYCQLLIGPKNHVPPVQSIWSDAKLASDSTSSMQKYIDMINGFQPGNEFVDHIAVQLQYMSVLLSMADQAKPKLIRGLAKAFANDHLSWTDRFLARAEQKATTGFYKGLASVSQNFLFG